MAEGHHLLGDTNCSLKQRWPLSALHIRVLPKVFLGSHGLSPTQSRGAGEGSHPYTAQRPPSGDLKRPNLGTKLTAPHPSPSGSTPNSAPSEHGVNASDYGLADSSRASKKRALTQLSTRESVLKYVIHDTVTATQGCGPMS